MVFDQQVIFENVWDKFNLFKKLTKSPVKHVYSSQYKKEKAT
jgi:hypothetical protein